MASLGIEFPNEIKQLTFDLSIIAKHKVYQQYQK
ncbi:unnamed protein product [Brassica rapa]|uniref:Uncharacterized protein n=1 Tax=Brassica campestris TaxID=3711 RepID=A0A8D9G5G7_BRACM|nr:unnamed protein product [Brassica rapa]